MVSETTTSFVARSRSRVGSGCRRWFFLHLLARGRLADVRADARGYRAPVTAEYHETVGRSRRTQVPKLLSPLRGYRTLSPQDSLGLRPVVYT